MRKIKLLYMIASGVTIVILLFSVISLGYAWFLRSTAQRNFVITTGMIEDNTKVEFYSGYDYNFDGKLDLINTEYNLANNTTFGTNLQYYYTPITERLEFDNILSGNLFTYRFLIENGSEKDIALNSYFTYTKDDLEKLMPYYSVIFGLSNISGDLFSGTIEQYKAASNSTTLTNIYKKYFTTDDVASVNMIDYLNQENWINIQIPSKKTLILDYKIVTYNNTEIQSKYNAFIPEKLLYYASLAKVEDTEILTALEGCATFQEAQELNCITSIDTTSTEELQKLKNYIQYNQARLDNQESLLLEAVRLLADNTSGENISFSIEHIFLEFSYLTDTLPNYPSGSKRIGGRL